MADLRDANVAM